MEAARHGIQAAAVSLGRRADFDFEEAAQFTAHLAGQLLNKPLPRGFILNVNVPAGGWQGVRVTRQDTSPIGNLIVESRDPRDRKYFWLDQSWNPETCRLTETPTTWPSAPAAFPSHRSSSTRPPWS